LVTNYIDFSSKNAYIICYKTNRTHDTTFLSLLIHKDVRTLAYIFTVFSNNAAAFTHLTLY